MDLRYKSYETIYSVGKESNPNPRHYAACFAAIFYGAPETRVVKVFLHKGEGKGNHYCPFGLKEIKNHMRQCQQLVKFGCSVKEEIINDVEGFVITLNFIDTPQNSQRYVLTWLRYLYEFPYVYYLIEAKRLKKLPCFRFESIANLFITVSSCYSHYNDGHSIQLASAHLLTRKKLSVRIFESRSLNSIYNNRNIRPNIGGEVTDTDMWTIDNFEKNVETYINQYKKLKK